MSITGYPIPAFGIIPVGALLDWPGPTVPALFLACDSSSVLRATYPALFSALCVNKGPVTITIASPGVFTLASHGLKVGDRVFLETTGALPTGLATDATANYYVFSVPTANTFTVGTGFSVSGSTGVLTPSGQVNTSGTQSGVHTLFHAPYGCADATHFTLPNIDIAHGQSPNAAGLAAVLGVQYGENTHLNSIAEAGTGPHGHTFQVDNLGGAPAGQAGVAGSSRAANFGGLSIGVEATGGVAAAAAHNNVPAITIVKKIIYAGA